MSVLDFVLGFGKIVATSIEAETSGILGQVLGMIGSLDPEDDDDLAGELSEKEDLYSGLGLLGNPLGLEQLDGKSYACDVVYAKRGDSLVPIAYRDLRLNRAFPSGLKKGSIALAGYGGGFYSLDLTTSNSGTRKANIHVLYCPYEFDADGVPAKAHVIFADPSQDSVGMVHGDGFAVMLNAGGITLRGGSSSWINVAESSIDIVSAKVNVQGSVALGGNPAIAVPLLAGPASPPGPNVSISPV